MKSYWKVQSDNRETKAPDWRDFLRRYLTRQTAIEAAKWLRVNRPQQKYRVRKDI